MTSASDNPTPVRFTDADAASVMGQLDATARARLPLAPALMAMAEETYSPRTRRGLRRVAARLERGETLPQALESVDLRMSAALRLLSQQGTHFGRFDEVLHWTVEQTRRSSELRRQLWLALAYPFLLLSVAAVIGAFLFLIVVPMFGKIFEDFGTELPVITRGVVMLARFGVDYWYMCLLVAVVLAAAVTFCSLFLWQGHWLMAQRWSGSIPLIGPLFRLAALSEFCHLLGVFVSSEMPLATSVLVAGESSEDEWLKQATRQLALDIDRGITAEQAALTCGFPASLVQVLRETSSSHNLADALHGLAEVYSARTEVNSRLTSTIIEPFVMVVVVVGLGVVVVSLFMPLIKLLNDLS